MPHRLFHASTAGELVNPREVFQTSFRSHPTIGSWQVSRLVLRSQNRQYERCAVQCPSLLRPAHDRFRLSHHRNDSRAKFSTGTHFPPPTTYALAQIFIRAPTATGIRYQGIPGGRLRICPRQRAPEPSRLNAILHLSVLNWPSVPMKQQATHQFSRPTRLAASAGTTSRYPHSIGITTALLAPSQGSAAGTGGHQRRFSRPLETVGTATASNPNTLPHVHQAA